MVDAGEASLAEDFRQQLALPPDALRVDPAAIAAAEAARREAYLQLPLPGGAVVVVDGSEGLAAAGRALAAADAVGLDVEW